jgi:hypothetical protein
MNVDTTTASVPGSLEQILQSAKGDTVYSRQRATTPTSIDRILVDTPTFNDRDAAEALGKLASPTTTELATGTRTTQIGNKRKAHATIPATSTPK